MKRGSEDPMTEVIRKQTSPRVFFEEPVSMISETGETFSGFALNLSCGGMFVRTAKLLTEGSLVDCRFSLPGENAIHAEARVVRAVAAEEGREPGGLALRFEVLEADSADRIDRFVTGQLLPPSGDPVRLQLGELGLQIGARAQSWWGSFVSVDAELPFLRLGSPVCLHHTDRAEAGGAGTIRWISIHLPPGSSVPRLNIGIELGAPPPAEQSVEDEQDPVCNESYSEHSSELDRQVRSHRRAAVGA